MRLLVTLEQRFRKLSTGGYFANGTFNYAFFSRYLSVFDEVLVFARVCTGDGAELDSYRADGPGVCFFEVPYYVGPMGYLKMRRPVQRAAETAIRQADAFMLRVPGIMGALVWKHLRRRDIPYGVEVVGDPWDSVGTCSSRSLMRPLLRQHAYWTMRRQCREAAVAAYVTEHTLQARYPAGGWATSYSSVELAERHLLDDADFGRHLAFLNEPFVDAKRPFRLCHIGSMDALYKAQDTLIEAVSLCRMQRGLSVELILVGDGRYRAMFEQKAKDMNVAEVVHFAGNLSPEVVRDVLDRSDVFVLPSLTEGLPRVLIEAMARGLPCLASRVGGVPELLEEDYLFAVRDFSELAWKIECLIGDYERLCAAARRNLARAHAYRADILSEKRQTCYQHLRTITEHG